MSEYLDQHSDTISGDIDVIVAAYDDQANGRSGPAAMHERAIFLLTATDDIFVESETEEEYTR